MRTVNAVGLTTLDAVGLLTAVLGLDGMGAVAARCGDGLSSKSSMSSESSELRSSSSPVDCHCATDACGNCDENLRASHAWHQLVKIENGGE